MKIDVRNHKENVVDGIVFGITDEFLKQGLHENMIEIVDDHNESFVEIYKKDIDYLIKALQKAKELWGDGE